MNNLKISMHSTKNAKKNGRVYLGELNADGAMTWVKPKKDGNGLYFSTEANEGSVFVAANNHWDDRWVGEMAWMVVVDGELFKVKKEEAHQLATTPRLDGEIGSVEMPAITEAVRMVPDWIEIFECTPKV